MSWLGLLLLGMSVSDLVFSVRPMRRWPEVVGAFVAVLGGLVLCGLTTPRDVAALVLVALAVVAWGQSVTYGFGRGRAVLPLTVGAVALGLVVLASVWSDTRVQGPFADWLSASPWSTAGLEPDRALLMLGVLLFQLSTGNVVVRLVLAATGSRNPRAALGGAVDHGQDDVRPLKGGRLLGPMERLLIVGLGLAGQITAASIVIAAKGLLRFPELQASRDDELGPGIHEVTEYFLVGSFVSWLVALGGLVLAVA